MAAAGGEAPPELSANEALKIAASVTATHFSGWEHHRLAEPHNQCYISSGTIQDGGGNSPNESCPS